ncbi:MAG: Gfo/Idh/MocA family oxidoreductase [Pseudonocardiales bacterium]|nr:Gfo/Idh/MocA family oxidoreductase [Actinomycetota bacterium]
MPVRTGVIGAGVMGAEHARLLSDAVSGSDVTAVFDVDPARAEAVATGSGARVFDDPMVLIKDDSIDAVLIASADRTHEQFVLACLAVGKPVLCEKPLTPDVAGSVRIMDAESELGAQLVTVGFMRRYDPGYVEMKQTLRDGALGPALLMRCVHRNAASVPVPSAVLISGSAVHEIDIARWVLDEELVSATVHCPRRSAKSGDTQDPMLLVFASAGGVLVDVEVFLNAGYGYDVRCEIVAESGTVLLDAPSPTVRRAAGASARTVPGDWRQRFGEAYRRELQDWIDAVATGQPPRGASVWDGYAATVVADAGVRALATGRTQEAVLRDKPALYR